MKRFVARVRSVTRSQDGTVAIHMALTLASLLGMAELATDVGLVLYQQRQMQAAADAAAFSAALALSTGNPSYETEAKAVAGQNGFVSGANGATVTVNNPPVSPAADAGNADAVQVIITQTQATLFAGVVSSGPFNISAQAVAAAIPTSSPACVLALSSSAGGVQLSGGTSISAPSCVVASQELVVVPCGDSIVAEDVYYNGAAPTVGCAGGIVGTIKKISTPDPLASNAGIIAAEARAAANESLAAPTMPTMPSRPTGGTSITFDWSNQAASETPAGCTATSPAYSANWTVTCAAGGTYNFGSLTVSGGAVTFSASATYNFSGTVTNSGKLTFGSGTFNIVGGLVTNGGTTTTFGSGAFNIWGTVTNGGGSSLSFGSGTFNLAGGLVTNGGSTTTFGAGTFNIGPATSCPQSNYSICHGGTTITFGGPSTFVITSGIYNDGGETIAFGAGTSTNSYQIGPSSGGYAFYVGGGSRTTLGDATGSNSVFQMVGDLYQSGGGSSFTLPAATDHDIDGTVSLTGGLTLGSGLYAIAGNFWLGIGGGGGSVSGSGVTIAVTGSPPKALGALSSNVVEISAGYDNVSLSAPSSGTYEKVAIVGPPLANPVTGGIQLNEGAADTTVGGALYFPNGPMTLSGGASIGYPSNSCLEIVASTIQLSGGTSISAAQCFAASSGSGAPLLVE